MYRYNTIFGEVLPDGSFRDGSKEIRSISITEEEVDIIQKNSSGFKLLNTADRDGKDYVLLCARKIEIDQLLTDLLLSRSPSPWIPLAANLLKYIIEALCLYGKNAAMRVVRE